MATPTSLSIGDRIAFALIGGVFGAVMGAILLFFVVFGLAVPRAPAGIILFSAAYFGLVGFVMGGFVGDFVGATIGGVFNLFAIEQWMHPGFTDERTFRPFLILLLFVLWLLG